MNLFVGNLNPETTAAKLRPLFAEFGEVISAKVIIDNATGMSRGFGFVEMADKFQSFDAIDNIDATYFDGNVISVKEAKQNNTKPGGGFNKSAGGARPFNKPRTGPRPGGSSSYSRPAGGGFNRNSDSSPRSSDRNTGNSDNFSPNKY
jgi:RNA recognition motif-containing protein